MPTSSARCTASRAFSTRSPPRRATRSFRDESPSCCRQPPPPRRHHSRVTTCSLLSALLDDVAHELRLSLCFEPHRQLQRRLVVESSANRLPDRAERKTDRERTFDGYPVRALPAGSGNPERDAHPRIDT